MGVCEGLGFLLSRLQRGTTLRRLLSLAALQSVGYEVVMAKRAQTTANDRKKSWTIAVFMVGGPELGPSLSRDLLELERVGSNEDVNVIVAEHKSPRSQSKWSQLLQRNGDALAKRESIGGSTKEELDERLDEFLALAATKYPAAHYLLIMWGHASGLQFGQLGPGSEKDQLRLRELATSLRKLRDARDDKKLDILGFCACALSKAEFAIELRNEVDYLVSSQVGISTLMTWPFDDIVNLALTSPSVEPATYASQIVQCFEESYEPPPVALTALDLQKSEDLGHRVNELSQTILKALEEPGKVGTLNNLCVLRAFTQALDAHPYELEPLVDFYDFCRKLVQEEHVDEGVRDTARNILDEGTRFVVQNVRSGPKLSALHGLSILAPDFDDPNWTQKGEKFAKDTSKAYLWQYTDWALMAQRVHAFAMSRTDI
jgi:cysteine peptidase C11 family protein